MLKLAKKEGGMVVKSSQKKDSNSCHGDPRTSKQFLGAGKNGEGWETERLSWPKASRTRTLNNLMSHSTLQIHLIDCEKRGTEKETLLSKPRNWEGNIPRMARFDLIGEETRQR